MYYINEFKNVIKNNFPYENYLYVKPDADTPFESETYYRIERYKNPIRKKLKKYVKVTNIKEEINNVINNIAFSGFYDRLVLCAFNEHINEMIEQIIPIIKNKKYEFYSDEYVTTNNGLIINTKSGYIININKHGHIYRNVNVSIEAVNKISYDVFITLIKQLIRLILFNNKNIILEYSCVYSKDILIDIIKDIFIPYSNERIVVGNFFTFFITDTKEINIFKNIIIYFVKKDDVKEFTRDDCFE